MWGEKVFLLFWEKKKPWFFGLNKKICKYKKKKVIHFLTKKKNAILPEKPNQPPIPVAEKQ